MCTEKRYLMNGLWFTTYPVYRHRLYKSQKGQFFIHVGEYVGKTGIFDDEDYIEVISEEKTKKILNQLNLIEKYEEIFNDLEEG